MICSKKYEINTITCFLLLIAVSVVIVLASPVIGITGRPYYAGDSSVFKTIALQMQDGLMPYKDTFDHKGPLLYLIHFASLFISPWYGICVFEFIFIFVSVIFWFKTVKLIFNNNNTALFSTGIGIWAIISYYIERNQAEEFLLCFISVSLFIFVKYFKVNRVNKLEVLVCGACFASVVLIKFNAVIIFIPFLIAILIDLINKKNLRHLFVNLLYFILGLLIVGAPIMAWLVFNDSFYDFWSCYVSFNSKYTAYFIKQISWSGLFLYTINPFILFPIIIILYKAVKTKSKMWISYAVAFIAELIVLNFGTHKLYILIVLIPLIIPSCAILINSLSASKDKRVCYLAKSAIVVLLIGGLVIGVAWFVKNGHATFGSHNDEYDVAQYIKDNTGDKDKVLIYENCDVLYLLSDRMPASKFSYTAPVFLINEDFKEEYMQDILDNKPTFIIIWKDHVHNIDELMFKLNNTSLVRYSEDKTMGAYIIYKLNSY